MQQAFVATEDARFFYEHHGVDFPSVFRALYKDILVRGKSRRREHDYAAAGEKNVFLTNEKNIAAKKTKRANHSIKSGTPLHEAAAARNVFKSDLFRAWCVRD
ncbi:hypothetical protein GCM10020331_081040 [Ectobacillus funiculus]